MDVWDSAVKSGNLVLGDFAFGELFLQPWADELLWFLEGDLVWVINGDIEPGNSVCDDGNTCTHLAWTDDSKGLDAMAEESSDGFCKHLDDLI